MEGVQYHENGIKELGIYTPCITIDANGGRIVAYVGSDIDSFSEMYIDFTNDDNEVMQLAVVGQTHDGSDEDMHAYVYNGVDECCAWEHEIEVSDNSHWYEYQSSKYGNVVNKNAVEQSHETRGMRH